MSKENPSEYQINFFDAVVVFTVVVHSVHRMRDGH